MRSDVLAPTRGTPDGMTTRLSENNPLISFSFFFPTSVFQGSQRDLWQTAETTRTCPEQVHMRQADLAGIAPGSPERPGGKEYCGIRFCLFRRRQVVRHKHASLNTSYTWDEV